MEGGRASLPRISILEADHSIFPEVLPLNPAFREATRKLKISVEVDPELAVALTRAGKDFVSGLLTICPSLKNHRCRGGNGGVAPLDAAVLGEISGRRLADDPVDVAHLLEHMAIDLVVEIGGTRRCSGATCALRNPENRFHVFVECEDKYVGLLAIHLAASALTRLLRSEGDPLLYRRQVNLARWMVGRNGDLCTTTQVAGELRCSESEAREAVRELARLGFLTEEIMPLNFSGLTYFTRGTEIAFGTAGSSGPQPSADLDESQ